MSAIKALLREEIQFSTHDLLDPTLSPVVQARCVAGNYRLAEAELSRQPNVHRIQKIRTLLSRGKIAEARALIGAGDDDNDARLEARVELARSQSFDGDWTASLLTANESLSAGEVCGVTLLTLLQIRLNALFELREYGKAQREYESAAHLAHLYPHAPVRFYTDTLGCKILAKLGKTQEAESLFDFLLERARGNRRGLNPDELLTLFRLRSYLNREIGEPSRVWSRAGYWLARAMGDDLYAALGLLECYPAAELRSGLSDELRSAAERYKRVQHFVNALSGSHFVTDAVASAERTAEASFSAQELSSPDALYVLDWKVRIDFRSLEARKWADTEQNVRILRYLAGTRACTRKSLFENVWGIPFKPAQHQTTLAMALKRFSSRAGLKLARDSACPGGIRSPAVSLLK